MVFQLFQIWTDFARCTHINNNHILFYYPGDLHITPLNCNSTSDGVCIKHVKRGQPLTLCTSHTTTPSTIPQEKHIISVSSSTWWVYKNPHLIQIYSCLRESCTEVISSDVNHTRYSNVSDFCITINNLQEKEERYFLVTHFYPGPKYILRVIYKTIFDISPGGMLACVWSGICLISIHCRGYAITSLYDVML